MKIKLKYLLWVPLVLVWVSCTDPVRPVPPGEIPVDEPARSFLALGDSYTIGQSVPVSDRWPNQLVGQLREKGFYMADPQIIAMTGWTTANLLQTMQTAQLTPPYDMVTLLIGVNDQYQGRTLESYRQGFTALLTRAVELADADPARVIVVSIPDYSVTPFAEMRNPARIRTALNQFNALNLELAFAAGVHYVDITPGSREAAADLSLLAPDQLHPSGKMYAEWVKLILPVAEGILEN